MELSDMGGRQWALFLVSVIFAAISTLVVGLRVVARAMIRGFWTDDWMMVVAQLLFAATCVLSALGAMDGIGLRDRELPYSKQEPARLKVFVFQIIYSFALFFVKTSICLMLYRITTSKPIRYFLWFIIFLSFATTFAVLGVSLSLCKPIEGLWNGTSRTACPANVTAKLNGIFIFGAVTAVITDFSCSIIPYVIIFRLQMPRKTKILLSSVLGLSFLACAACLVRLQWVPKYSSRVDFLYGLAEPYIWTIVEIGVAVIVGSVPALKPLLKKMGVISGGGSTGAEGQYHHGSGGSRAHSRIQSRRGSARLVVVGGDAKGGVQRPVPVVRGSQSTLQAEVEYVSPSRSSYNGAAKLGSENGSDQYELLEEYVDGDTFKMVTTGRRDGR